MNHPGNTDICADFDRAQVQQSLQQGRSKEDLIGTLGFIGRKGEENAAVYGYGPEVAAMLYHPEPEVVAAACECLGNMGPEGASYVSDIAQKLSSDDEGVRAASAGALGAFGGDSLKYEGSITACLKDKAEAVVVAAMVTLGALCVQSQAGAIAENLGSQSPVLAAAACQALGAMGQWGVDQAPNIAKRLGDPATRYAALCALGSLGPSVVTKYVDDIVEKCLADGDGMTRQTAASTLGGIATDVLQNKGAISKIKEYLKHSEAGVRCTAALALGHMGEEARGHAQDVADLLKDAGEDESENYLQMGGGTMRAPPSVRKPKCAALVALGMLGGDGYAEKISQALQENSWEVKVCALDALASLGEPGKSQGAKIAACLDDDVFVVRLKACECLGSLQVEDQMHNLPEVFEDKAPSVKAAALTALASAPEVAAGYSNEVFKCMGDNVQMVRAAAIAALGVMGETGQSYAGVIASCLEDQDDGVRAAACEALGKLGDYGAAFAEEVAYSLQDPMPEVRAAAATALGNMGTEGAAYAGELRMLADDPFCAQAAQDAFAKLEG